MPSQILQIKPELELTFRGPFDKVVTSVLKLKNPSVDTVAFKVKTTAPKRYCVRPNSGLVHSKSEVEVSVMLQPFEYDPAEKARHKFMVQSLVVKESSVESLDELWKAATADSLMDSKLKVVLEPGVGEPDAAAAAAAGKTGGAGADQSTASSSSAAAASAAPSVVASATSPAAAVGEPGAKPSGGSSPAAQRRPPATSAGSDLSAGSKESQQQQQPQASTLSSGGESMRSLQQEIQRLKDDNARLTEQELRLRKLAMRDTKASEVPGQHHAAAAAAANMPSSMALAQQAGPALPPVLFLVLALVLGLVVGKFIL